MVYLKSVENDIPLSKLIGPCFYSVSPILFLKTKRNDLARPIMGTIFGERAKRARHSQVCSIENRGYIY